MSDAAPDGLNQSGVPDVGPLSEIANMKPSKHEIVLLQPQNPLGPAYPDQSWTFSSRKTRTFRSFCKLGTTKGKESTQNQKS